MGDRQAFLDAIQAAPDDEAPKKVYADWLDEQGEHDEAARYRGWDTDGAVLPELADFDWDEAFQVAFRDDKRRGHPVEAAKQGDPVLLRAFGRRDVKRLVAKDDGANDGPDWVCVGELYDGRFFALRAGCDYTGWG